MLTDGPWTPPSLLPRPCSLPASRRPPHGDQPRGREPLLARPLHRAGRDTARLARLTLEALAGVQRGVLPPEMTALLRVLARRHGLFKGEVPGRAEFGGCWPHCRPASGSGWRGLQPGARCCATCGEALREQLARAWRLIHDVRPALWSNTYWRLRSDISRADCLGADARGHPPRRADRHPGLTMTP